MKEAQQDTLDEVLTLSDTEISFWQSVGIDPYYMYIDDTLTMVNEDFVEIPMYYEELFLYSNSYDKEGKIENVVDPEKLWLLEMTHIKIVLNTLALY